MARKLAILVTLMMVMAIAASATPIPLNTSNTSPANAGDATVLAWLNGLITTYNAANNPDLPAATAAAFKVDQGGSAPSGFPTFGANVTSITLDVTGYEYLVFHWGGPGGGTWQAFDLNGTNGDVTFLAPSRNGLSSYAFFNPTTTTTTPEPASLALLGSGLIGLALRRRKK